MTRVEPSTRGFLRGGEEDLAWFFRFLYRGRNAVLAGIESNRTAGEV